MNEAQKGGPVDRSAQQRGPSPKSTAVKIKADQVIPSAPEKPKRKYWIGTIKDSPFQNLTVAGTTFPSFTGRPHFDEKGTPTSRPEPGIVVHLDEDQVERIKSGAAGKVFRMVKDRALLLSRAGSPTKPYSQLPIDQPVGRFIYMHDVTDGFPPSYHGGTPETMID